MTVLGASQTISLATECSGPGNYATTVAWSPDQRIIAAGCQDGTIVFIEDSERLIPGMRLSSSKVTATGHAPDPVRDIAWSPDGMRLVSVGEDGWMRIWDWNGTATGIAVPYTGTLHSVDWSPDGRRLAVSEFFVSQPTVHVVEPVSLKDERSPHKSLSSSEVVSDPCDHADRVVRSLRLDAPGRARRGELHVLRGVVAHVEIEYPALAASARAIPAAVAVAGFLVHGLGSAVASLAPFRYLSPIYWFLGNTPPLLRGFSAGPLVLLAASLVPGRHGNDGFREPRHEALAAADRVGYRAEHEAASRAS